MFRAFTAVRHMVMSNTAATHSFIAGSSPRYRFQNHRHHRHYNNLSDRELQESFKGFWPKFLSLLKVLSTDAGRQGARNLYHKNLIMGDKFGLYTYALLQNPLLIKYGFDIFEFAIGAKYAYQKHMSALLSAEFRNFAKGLRKSSAAATFLQNSTSKQLYNDYLTTLKEGSGTAIVDHIVVDLIHPFHMATHIIRNDEKPIESPFLDLMYWLRLLPPKVNIMCDYPDDSVVATVRVFYFSKEIRCMRCEFEGCISGHVPLDWKIKGLRESIV